MKKLFLTVIIPVVSFIVSQNIVNAQPKFYNVVSKYNVKMFQEDSLFIDSVELIKDNDKIQVLISEDEIILFDSVELHIEFEEPYELEDLNDTTDLWLLGYTEEGVEIIFKLIYSNEIDEWAFCVVNNNTCEGYLYFFKESFNNSKNKTNGKMSDSIFTRMEKSCNRDEKLFTKTKYVIS